MIDAAQYMIDAERKIGPGDLEVAGRRFHDECCFRWRESGNLYRAVLSLDPYQHISQRR